MIKQFALFICLSFIIFSSCFVATRFYQQKKQFAEKSAQFFTPAPFVLKNHPFAIVITGYNNGATVEKTLTSVFSQNYENYRLIYIDDASDNGSFDLARDFIYASGHLPRVTFIQNETHLGQLANISRAIRSCRDEEIVVVLPEADWLAHEWVLQRLNSYYSNPDLWLGLAQNIHFPSYQLSTAPHFNDIHVRTEAFFGSQLKTFYASLFKQIHESDFFYGGTFLPNCAELAYMIPMLEMGKNHIQFISEVLCVTHRNSVDHEDRELNARCEKFVRSLDPYLPLTALHSTKVHNLKGELR